MKDMYIGGFWAAPSLELMSSCVLLHKQHLVRLRCLAAFRKALSDDLFAFVCLQTGERDAPALLLLPFITYLCIYAIRDNPAQMKKEAAAEKKKNKDAGDGKEADDDSDSEDGERKKAAKSPASTLYFADTISEFLNAVYYNTPPVAVRRPCVLCVHFAGHRLSHVAL